MKVTLFTGILGLLAQRMQVYRDAVLARLTVEHPGIEVREQCNWERAFPVCSGLINRYLRYFPGPSGWTAASPDPPVIES